MPRNHEPHHQPTARTTVTALIQALASATGPKKHRWRTTGAKVKLGLRDTAAWWAISDRPIKGQHNIAAEGPGSL